MDTHRAPGFTLVELVLVMVVISVGLLGLTSLFSGNINALIINEGSQQVAQYAQECAERVVAVRRDSGFASSNITTSMCDSMGALPSGFVRTVTVPATYTGNNSTCNGNNPCPCPNGVNCRDVTITVSNGTVSSNITLMLANY